MAEFSCSEVFFFSIYILCCDRASFSDWQELALSAHECLSLINRCGIHAVCAAFLGMLSQLDLPSSLQQHVTLVRSEQSEHSRALTTPSPHQLKKKNKCLSVRLCCFFYVGGRESKGQCPLPAARRCFLRLAQVKNNARIPAVVLVTD